MARAIGMTWVRLHDAGGLEWYHLEPEPGQWVFRDDTIRRFRDSKFEILGLLGTSPLWANAWPDTEKKPIHSFWDKWGAPGDPDAFARYVRTVTDRYRKDIRVYEVWNEPWIPRFFSARREPQPRGEPLYFHSDHPQRDYAGLSRTAAAALADGDTGVRLVGLNSTAGTGISNRISGADWSAGVVAEGEYPYGGQVQHAAGRIYFRARDPPFDDGTPGDLWDYVCSGTAIKDNKTGRSIVLTAGHCVWEGTFSFHFSCT